MKKKKQTREKSNHAHINTYNKCVFFSSCCISPDKHPTFQNLPISTVPISTASYAL